MGKEVLMFGDREIEKKKFTAIKVLFFRRYRYWEILRKSYLTRKKL